ncbi:MAG: hypothetical protein JXM68_12605, partial [Sedimentisphaerales bacterium]|nr:hypothetical protein [Sedimentisphaerales bacterium]
MQKRSWLSLGLFFSACCSLHATVLTGVGGSNNDPVPQDHGSFVQDTPNIALNWSPTGGGNNSRNQWEQYNSWPLGGDGGQVYQIDSSDTYSEHLITFTPQGGFDVRLNSLDLNVWGGGGATAVNWTVTGSVSGELGSGTFNTADGAAVTHNINITGNSTEALTLSLLQTSGLDSYLALDNLNFSQLPTGSVVYTAPANGAVEVPLSTSLQWNIATGKQIAGYYVYLGTTPAELVRLNSTMLSKQTASYAVALESDNTYYWQIEQAMFTDPNGTSGIIHPAGDPNNYLADTWHFATVRSRVIFDDAYPQNILVAAGDEASFTAPAQDPLGGTIIYQWYFDADPTTPEGAVALTNGSKYTGCDTASLTVKNAQLSDQGSYYCSGLNASTFTQNSASASLIIKRKLAHWSLDAASYVNSYYQDLSGNNNTAAVNGTPTFAAGLVDGDQNVGNAVNNGAVYFTTISGTASAGAFNPSADTDMFTVSCWVNRQHIINDVLYNVIAAKRDGWSSGS